MLIPKGQPVNYTLKDRFRLHRVITNHARLGILISVFGCVFSSIAAPVMADGFSIIVANDTPYYQRPALKKLRSDFFGVDNTSSSGNSEGSGLSYRLQSELDVPIEIATPNIRFGLSYSTHVYNGHNYFAKARVGVETGSGSYRLPEGLPPFIEPIDVTFSYTGVSGDIRFGKYFYPSILGKTALYAGLGWERVSATTLMQSPVLDITSQYHGTHHYSLFGIEFTDNRFGKSHAFADLRINPDLVASFNVGLRFEGD